jgi:aspartate/methionine/tyrosine aminotransferase
MKGISSRMSRIPFEGGIREILAAASNIEKSGRKMIHFEIGRPDYDSPEDAKRSSAKALEEGFVHYTPLEGIQELREGIAAKEGAKGVSYSPDDEIIVTCGAVEALMVAFITLLDMGDEVIIPTPCFPAYHDQVLLAGGVPVTVPSILSDGYHLDLDAIEKAISSKTRIVIISSPNNPSGGVIDRKSLHGLARIAEEHDLYVISDNCYEDFLYEGDLDNFSSIPGMRERTLVVNSLSKTFSMTGWRVGYIAAERSLYKYLLKVHQLLSTSACSFAQVGAAEALRTGWDMTRRMVEDFRNRKEIVLEALSRCDGLTCMRPKGAFYAFPSIEALNMESLDFCSVLLEEEGVATVPGDAFGSPRHVRIAYTCPVADVREGMNKFVSAYQRLFRLNRGVIA